ncbi:MAG: hypothetical protein IT176_13705 [Acidobacteria bacterium]|nr:hypothetical protein [Acidobacteriota bacterium]
MPGPATRRATLIALAYLWLLALVPLLADADDEVRWHAKHGLVLAAAEFVLLCAYLVLAALAGIAALAFGFILMLLIPLGWIGVLALHAAAIVKALNGRRLRVPVLSELANRW